MSDYAFFVRMLRFVAAKSERVDQRVTEMMEALEDAAGEIEARGVVTVPAGRLEVTARAFAGVAGFLQKQILPEAVAHGNAVAERDIRWMVDASMEAVNLLLRHVAEGVEAGGEAGPVEVRFPAPPQSEV